MPTQMSAEQRAEYDELRRHLEAFTEFLVASGAVPGDTVPLLREGLDVGRQLPPAGALRGVRMAVADMLEMSRHVPAEWVEAADAFLAGRGAVSLSMMRRRIWRLVPRILARGRIRSEEEYCILIERLNDVDDPALTAADRSLGERLLAEDEERSKSGPGAV